MEDARTKGLSDGEVARILDIDAREIGRTMEGLTVSEISLWEKISARRVVEEK
jgi:hypothetical protein